jgi:hypothetical protein
LFSGSSSFILAAEPRGNYRFLRGAISKEGSDLRTRYLFSLAIPAVVLFALGGATVSAGSGGGLGPGVGNVPQGTQADTAFAQSYGRNHVTNVFATNQNIVSCYRPEVPAPFNNGATNGDGYTGESVCPGATTGENTGGTGSNLTYSTQIGSNPGFPMPGPQLVKDRSESDIRVDPNHPSHVIGSSKWFVDAEGYNHLLGFYESFDGGKTFPVQGHIPGYEGWTDNTDPVGAFDTYGNYYELILPYQFDYSNSGGHQFSPGQEPNPAVPNEAVSVAVRPVTAGTDPTKWFTTHNGQPDYVTTTDASFGQEPDKQWITIDNNPNSPNKNTIYAMWVIFNGSGSKAFVSTAHAKIDGTHTDWTPPQALPDPGGTNNNTYLLPHVAPDGTAWTSITNFTGQKGKCCTTFGIDYSLDDGQTWNLAPGVIPNIQNTPAYDNTTFRTGIENTFAVGNHLDAQGFYPLYIAYEDHSAGITNVVAAVSFDRGATWQNFVQVNDNVKPVDEFQPNLAVAQDGTVSVNFYDRRLACPAAGTTEAAAAGLALDTFNPNDSAVPPYGATNYCVNAAVQFYHPDLTPIGHNIRIQQHTWDPQLNAAFWIAANVDGAGDTFIGDYFGNDTGNGLDYATFVSTYDTGNGANPQHYQQQVVATVAVP